MEEKILITGGLGYIGSHVASYLGSKSLILDNKSNSMDKLDNKIEKIIDSVNNESLSYIFRKFKIQGVIHLASLKAVNESIKAPLEYYENNLISSLTLLKYMKLNNVDKLIKNNSMRAVNE